MTNYLKLMEVAHRLGISERTARRYVTRGELPSVYVGNSYRVREEDLEEYLRQAEVKTGPKAEAPSAKASPGQPSDSEATPSKYLRAWRAYACRLRDEWQKNPPTSEAEIRPVVSGMQALIDEGAFGQAEDGAEWFELVFLFHAVKDLSNIVEDAPLQNELRQLEEANPSLLESAAGV